MTDSPRATRAIASLQPGQRTLVIGAGPAGLTAAYLLASDGRDVTVLEADEVVGGISRTARYRGFRFDIGGHRFFTKIPAVERLWEEILGTEFISVPRLSRIYYDGKFFDYPLKAMNALRGLGVLRSLQCVASYAHAHFRPLPVEENLEQWVTNRFGRRLFEIFFKTYTEKVWGMSCTEISAEWAAQRIQNLSLGKAILTAASLNRRSTAIKSLISSFRYPRLGPGQMWEAARDRIRERGGRVLMGHRVAGVELQGRSVAALHVETHAGRQRIAGDHVISSMPIRSLVRALPDVPEPVRQAAEGLRYRDFIAVALIVRRADLFPDNWIYVHSPGVRVGRIQNFGNWSAEMVPEPGTSCIGMEYFCFAGDGLWTSSDEDLVALARREIGVLGLVDPELVVDGAVVRMPKAYPIYDGGYRDHLEAVRRYLDGIPNLQLVGRNGLHKYNNQDHSMLTAMMAVENLYGTGSHDVWAVNSDLDYHEEIRVGESREEEAVAAAR